MTGNIDDGGSDNDVLATLLQEGRTYLIEVKGSETCHGTMPDPSIMELVAAKPGSLEASFAGATEVACPNISDCGDDDGGQGLNSRIVYSPRETNLFYINVSDLKVNFTPEPLQSQQGGHLHPVGDRHNGHPAHRHRRGTGDLHTSLRRRLSRRREHRDHRHLQ